KQKFTIIIPVAKDADYSKTLKAIKKLSYNPSKVELILVFGNHPARQRNLAALKAKGDILYFLDNDSVPGKNNLALINQFMQENRTEVMGGPSLAGEKDSSFQKTASLALGSFIGSAFSRSRYTRTGEPRQSDESELILCNMAVNKKLFLKMKGFNPKLYPNEENEFLNRIKKTGKPIFYHPELVVYRGHRKNLSAFIRQIFTYGRGRGEEVSIHPSDITLFPLISLGFNLYIISLLFISFRPLFIPGLIYSFIIIMASLLKTYTSGRMTTLLLLPLLYFVIHTFYGTGFLFGLIRSIIPVKRKKIKFQYKIKWVQKI
ncbi:MAG: glycosyltransferase, partial [Spirochaetes bacterium]|nr:glycosyltransferase [Spirochaetota bacterium]